MKKWAAVIVALGGALASTQLPHPYDNVWAGIVALAAAVLKSPSQS